MKSDGMDTENITLGGTLDEADGKDVPRVYKLYIVYVGKTGIVHRDAISLREDQPLSIGSRSMGKSSEDWLHLADERVSREHARISRY